jgi:hypothetical protein
MPGKGQRFHTAFSVQQYQGCRVTANTCRQAIFGPGSAVVGKVSE